METGNNKTIRIVSRESDGSLRIRDYDSFLTVLKNYDQIGIDDCSTDLSLRGFPLLKGLVGPIAEGRKIARYETADVFEVETRQWAGSKSRKRKPAGTAHQTTCHFPVLDAGLPTDPAWIADGLI